MKEWFISHWQEILAYIGIGGGSGIIGKKLTDKQQDKKLKDHEDRIMKLETECITIKNDIQNNTVFDKQLRGEFKEYRDLMDKRLSRIEDKQDKIYDHLIKLSK